MNTYIPDADACEHATPRDVPCAECCRLTLERLTPELHREQARRRTLETGLRAVLGAIALILRESREQGQSDVCPIGCNVPHAGAEQRTRRNTERGPRIGAIMEEEFRQVTHARDPDSTIEVGPGLGGGTMRWDEWLIAHAARIRAKAPHRRFLVRTSPRGRVALWERVAAEARREAG